ncbi:MULTISPECIES: AAA family ATPase [unclassified Campylobacter]|uniref:AAA family ATPase n=1 Tax=unclassified Campylobacter TaxID=2593542 RepID=UPI001E148952|nr:AAA family ATPase [Campylobacter sp. RM9331]MBZ8006244.1 AAA family ATPase [Campylobacter sp. RM9332]
MKEQSLDGHKPIGDNKSALKSIKIKGLFGKYNYEINFNKGMMILVSENGIGKTTILKIIVAILNNNFEMLNDINFKTITIQISEENFTIQNINNISLSEFIKKVKNSTILKLEIESVMRRDNLTEDISLGKFIRIMKRYNLPLKRFLETAINELTIKPNFTRIEEENLFYPTYRRIEDKLHQKIKSRYSREIEDYRIAQEYKNFYSEYINFGMNDVSKTINSLLGILKTEANIAYTQMNANVINYFLGEKVESIKNYEKLDMRKVEVIMTRIGEKDTIYKLKAKLKSDNKNETNITAFLKFYIQKLINIYDSQQKIEKKLTQFTEVCSEYLRRKKMEYDDLKLTVKILDEDDKEIKLDDLSSGEKQIISIFSKVYLDIETPHILIIDEPELSLSIAWQKRFLRDIYDSGNISLLIATTHSPFIFKDGLLDYVIELDSFEMDS